MVAWIWVLIPIFGILAGMLSIWTEHRRKMAMIEKGMNPDERGQLQTQKQGNTLVGGLVVLAVGLAFLVAQTVGSLIKWILLPGFILLFIGIALVIGYYVTTKTKSE